MKRKLPVLISIVLALIISLAACQIQPVVSGVNQTDPPLSPSQQEPTLEPTLPNDPVNADTQPEEDKYITVDEAIAIALKDAGFKEADVTGLHGELEHDDGVTIYDVDFYKDGKEYDYEIHAETGKILKPVKQEEPKETDNSASTSSGKSTSSSSNKSSTSKSTSSSSNKSSTSKSTSSSSSKSSTSKQLTKDQAISKALSHAGLKKSQVSKLKAELDKDDGVTLYEVDFETADWEYEYEINAKTGKIIKAEKDRND